MWIWITYAPWPKTSPQPSPSVTYCSWGYTPPKCCRWPAATAPPACPALALPCAGGAVLQPAGAAAQPAALPGRGRRWTRPQGLMGGPRTGAQGIRGSRPHRGCDASGQRTHQVAQLRDKPARVSGRAMGVPGGPRRRHRHAAWAVAGDRSAGLAGRGECGQGGALVADAAVRVLRAGCHVHAVLLRPRAEHVRGPDCDRGRGDAAVLSSACQAVDILA